MAESLGQNRCMAKFVASVFVARCYFVRGKLTCPCISYVPSASQRVDHCRTINLDDRVYHGVYRRLAGSTAS